MSVHSRFEACSGCRRAVFTLCLACSACASRELARAPERPEQPWQITGSPTSAPPENADRARASSAPEGHVSIEAQRQYDLATLIDLAQRAHPETRMAWYAARRAALAVGLAEAEYLPLLSAEVIGGVQRTPAPIPKNLNPNGYFVTETRELVTLLSVKWLLFDFGRRGALVRGAEEGSFVANVAFTAAHEQLVFAISRDYFALSAARGRLRVAQVSLKNAFVALDASEARGASGVGTTVDIAQAKRQVAQAELNQARANRSERAAYAALVASLGIEPSGPLLVADNIDQPLPAAPSAELDVFIQSALARRSDIVAARGKLRAAHAAVDGASARYFPKVALSGQVFENWGALSTDDSPYYSVFKPGYNALLALSWDIFDGGARGALLDIARSEEAEARAALDHTREQAVKQVSDAYDAIQTSLEEHRIALALIDAATTAYDAALDAYRQGVGTYTDVVSAETALSQARADKESAHANVFSSAAALAFASGNILATRQR